MKVFPRRIDYFVFPKILPQNPYFFKNIPPRNQGVFKKIFIPALARSLSIHAAAEDALSVFAGILLLIVTVGQISDTYF